MSTFPGPIVGLPAAAGAILPLLVLLVAAERRAPVLLVVGLGHGAAAGALHLLPGADLCCAVVPGTDYPLADGSGRVLEVVGAPG